jgi:tripartite-type tricarboxylate transporter receptor subunit TctC
MHVRIGVAAALLAAGLALPAAAADPFPLRPVRIVVPYPPGGGTDVLARLVSRHLAESWRESVLVDNRPGAGGVLGLETVARALPDGHTLMAIAAGPLDDENLRHFAPIALFAAPPYLLVTHPTLKAHSVRELIALARAEPGKIAYGSTGGGAASHLATELFRSMAHIDILHVPYKGIGQAVGELLGGHVQMMIGPSQALMPHVKAGKLRVLGITSAKRNPVLPDVPTVSEAGLPGYEAFGWFGLVGPAALPRALVARINRDVNRVQALPELRERYTELGAEPAQLTPEQFGAFIRADNARWAKLVAQQDLRIERPRLGLK